MGPYGATGGPEDARYQAKVCGNHDLNPVRPIGDSWNQIWALRALQVPLGLPKGPFGAKRGTFGGPGGPGQARYQAKVYGYHDSNQVRPIGSSWDQIWPLLALQGPLGPPKGSFGAKTGPFVGPGGPEEARYKAKVCGNNDSNSVRPIGGSWDQIWTLWAIRVPLGPPKGPFGAKTGPFGALECRRGPLRGPSA